MKVVKVADETHARLLAMSARSGKSIGGMIEDWSLQAEEDGKLQSLRGWRKLDDTLGEILAELRRGRSDEQDFLTKMERLLGTSSLAFDRAAEKIPNRIESLVSIVRSFELETLKKQQEILGQFDELQVMALELLLRQRVGQSLAKNPDLQRNLEAAFEQSGLRMPDEVR